MKMAKVYSADPEKPDLSKPEKIISTFDICVNEVYYRIYLNKELNTLYSNEIVSYDYNGRGTILFRNPAYDQEKTKAILAIFFDGKTPDNQLMNTASMICKKMEKMIKNRIAPENKKALPIGRQKEQYLRDATYWAIKNFKDKDHRAENKKDVFERAYLKFQAYTTSQESFIKSLYRLWNEAHKVWILERVKNSENKQFTFQKFAKSYFKISSNTQKQRRIVNFE